MTDLVYISQGTLAVIVFVFITYVFYKVLTDFDTSDRFREEQRKRQGPTQPLREKTYGTKTDSTTSTDEH